MERKIRKTVDTFVADATVDLAKSPCMSYIQDHVSFSCWVKTMLFFHNPIKRSFPTHLIVRFVRKINE